VWPGGGGVEGCSAPLGFANQTQLLGGLGHVKKGKLHGPSDALPWEQAAKSQQDGSVHVFD
jgi:hypothetical protein